MGSALKTCVALWWKTFVIVATPLILLPLPVMCGTPEARCGYVILVMSVYWMTEAVHIVATAFIPVFAFPLLGVLSTSKVCQAYMKDTNMMFLGGLAVAVAVEYCRLHERIALFVLVAVGPSPKRLLLGFMVTTMFLSMWISNTAATAMLVPIVDAVLCEMRNPAHSAGSEQTVTLLKKNSIESLDGRKTDPKRSEDKKMQQMEIVSEDPNEEKLDPAQADFRDIAFLGSAFASNLGGTGSLTGTNPNLVLSGYLESFYPGGTGLNYATWLFFNVPGMVIATLLGWGWLLLLMYLYSRKYKTSVVKEKSQEEAVRQLIYRKYKDLGPVTFHEMAVAIFFFILVLLWVFRDPEVFPGWGTALQDHFGKEVKISSATPALLIVFILYVFPARPPCTVTYHISGKKPLSGGCLTWDITNKKLPWGVIILIGGGFAMAEAGKESKLTIWIGEQLQYFSDWPPEATLFIMCILTITLTNFMSNTAAAAILLPVLNEMALASYINPLYLLLPVTLCCSYAYMLPVATPPNAIVFSAAKFMPVSRMLYAGFVMNWISLFVMLIMIHTLGLYMFDLRTFPQWANSTIL